MAYDYWWGYTAAQLELMAVDQPVVVYKKAAKDKAPSKEKMMKLAERWKKERAGRKSYVGREVSLSEILSNKTEEKDGK